MTTVQDSIEVAQPVRTVYNQWTQFEDFPQFMEGVERVEQIDDTHVHWVAEIAGVRREWDAEILRQDPDRVIAWRSTSGARNDGEVVFESLGADRGAQRADRTQQVRGHHGRSRARELLTQTALVIPPPGHEPDGVGIEVESAAHRVGPHRRVGGRGDVGGQPDAVEQLRPQLSFLGVH